MPRNSGAKPRPGMLLLLARHPLKKYVPLAPCEHWSVGWFDFMPSPVQVDEVGYCSVITPDASHAEMTALSPPFSFRHWLIGKAVAFAGVLLGLWLGLTAYVLEAVPVWPLIGLVLAAAVMGAPIFTILGGAAVLLYMGDGDLPVIVAIETYALNIQPHLPAIPLFTLAGFILAEGNASERLLRVFRAGVGWIPGGTAIVCVLPRFGMKPTSCGAARRAPLLYMVPLSPVTCSAYPPGPWSTRVSRMWLCSPPPHRSAAAATPLPCAWGDRKHCMPSRLSTRDRNAMALSSTPSTRCRARWASSFAGVVDGSPPRLFFLCLSGLLALAERRVGVCGRLPPTRPGFGCEGWMLLVRRCLQLGQAAAAV